MAKRGVKSTMLSRVPPDVRAKVDADIVTVLEFPGDGGASDRPRRYQDVYNAHDLQEYGVSIFALKRYAQAVEVRHALSARKQIAEAVAEERADLNPAMRKIVAAQCLDRLLDDAAPLDTETLTDIARVVDRFTRTDLAQASARQRELDALFSRLSSNDAVRAFIAACARVFGADWTERREQVIAAMQEELKQD